MLSDYLRSLDSADNAYLHQLMLDREVGIVDVGTNILRRMSLDYDGLPYDDEFRLTTDRLLLTLPQYIREYCVALVRQYKQLAYSYGWLSEQDCADLLGVRHGAWLLT
jgi:hypothetical protein